MMGRKHTLCGILFGLLTFMGRSQDVAFNDSEVPTYARAYDLAYDGDHKSAEEILTKVLGKAPDHDAARLLWASTLSWKGKYAKARKEFNKITSVDRTNKEAWISAVKNELYAKSDATALGLANKALQYHKGDREIERLRQIALKRIEEHTYSELAWYNQESGLKTSFAPTKKVKNRKPKKKTVEKTEVAEAATKDKPKRKEAKEEPKNRFSVRNSFTIFDQRYEPMTNASVSYRYRTKYGSVIPRINYNNRSNKQGLQYDLTLYPKLAKRMYAYVNYGYSNASIFPKHRFGGDVYLGLPGAIEFSAGGRYIMTATRNVTAITNSLGHYRGNYYFSLRSYITPRPDKLTRFSGNLLVRKYLRDANNFFGVSFGMGFSPELRQLFADDELLAETLLYVESQRLGVAYQFSPRKTQNIYRTNISVRRQELAFDSGSFFWAISAGLTYNVEF